MNFNYEGEQKKRTKKTHKANEQTKLKEERSLGKLKLIFI